MEKPRKFINTPLLLDLALIFIMCFIILIVTGFTWGKYLHTGDFRFSIFPELIGDQAFNLVSNKFSNENFVFLSFSPALLFFKLLKYSHLLFFIFFGIPVLTYISTKFVLIKLFYGTSIKYETYSIFSSALAFYFALNPSIFDRYGHWWIGYSVIFFPIFVYMTWHYIKSDSLLSFQILIIPTILFTGAVGPQPVVVYFLSTLFLLITYLLSNFKEASKDLFLLFGKGWLLFVSGCLAFSHILFPIIWGQGLIRTSWELPTNSSVLSFYARKSDLISSISGTNYYAEIINFSSNISVGFSIFLLIIILMLFDKKCKLNEFILIKIVLILVLLIIITGYRSFKHIYDLIAATPVYSIMWLIKDPNMYYSYFLFSELTLLVYLAKLKCSNLSNILSFNKFIRLISASIIILHIFFILCSDFHKYRNFYKFVKIPDEYLKLSLDLEHDNFRNLWLPYDWYISKDFSRQTPYYPLPAYWLTKNKELTHSTEFYSRLIEMIQEEIYIKNCKNVHFIGWIITMHNLNIILDYHTIPNTLKSKTDDDRKKTFLAEECLNKIYGFYVYKTYEKIKVYKSSLKFNDNFSIFQTANTEYLDPEYWNQVLGNYDLTRSKGLALDINKISIFHESYNENWQSLENKYPHFVANFAAMGFYGTNQEYQEFSYKNQEKYEWITFFQKIIISILFFSGIFQFLNRSLFRNFMVRIAS